VVWVGVGVRGCVGVDLGVGMSVGEFLNRVFECSVGV
jgi:hypothetical protein